jgi:hypothetical protein
LLTLLWWGIQGDVDPGDGGYMVNRMDVLDSGLVRFGVESMVAVPIMVGGLNFKDESMPNTISEHNVKLSIPECAFKLW